MTEVRGSAELDSLLEPALIFLVDATGIPVLLSLLVLIFTSGGEDLSQLPKSQFELYQMGIVAAMDKRLLVASQEGTAAAGTAAARGAAIAYGQRGDDNPGQKWNKLFALEATGPKPVMVVGGSATSRAAPTGGGAKTGMNAKGGGGGAGGAGGQGRRHRRPHGRGGGEEGTAP